MFGALRRLFGRDSQIQDASQMPQGMLVGGQPVQNQAIQNGIDTGAFRQVNNGTSPQLPQGLRMQENPVFMPRETGIEDVNGLPVNPSYILKLLNRR